MKCPICGGEKVIRSGKIKADKVFRTTVKIESFQSYKCMNGHRFDGNTTGKYTNSFIEWAVYVYLRSLSLNRAVEIIRATHEKTILSKRGLLTMLENVMEELPTHGDINRLFHPRHSGHVAFDAVFFKWRRVGFGVMFAFDPKTFDIIYYKTVSNEGEEAWNGFAKHTHRYLKKQDIKIKAVYSDGGKYLVPAVKRHFEGIPYQICIVHKMRSMGQKVPIKSVHHSKKMGEREKLSILAFKYRFEEVILASSRNESIQKMDSLKQWIKTHPDPRFKKATNSLKRNFKLTLTHFNHDDVYRDNNMIEAFNSIIKTRLKLFKGFKKLSNIKLWLRLILLDYRFRLMRETRDPNDRNSSPLERAFAVIPNHYNWLKMLRTCLKLNYTNPSKKP